MDQTANLHPFQNQTLSFVFSNESNQAIFADRQFIRRMGSLASDLLAGIPVNKIFLLDVRSEGQLMEAVRKDQAVDNFQISYRSATGEAIPTSSTVIAATGESGNFLGSDFVLYPDFQAELPTNQNAGRITSHSDVIRAYVEMEMNSREPNHPRTFTQSYLVAQFNALQITLARINGPASRSSFEKIANNTTRSMGLPIYMENGCLTFAKIDIDIKGYRNLMQTAVNYAVNAVGKAVVKREMLLVDKNVRPGTLELIAQMDLRIFSES